MAHSEVGKLIEQITGKRLPQEPRDPWEAGRGDPNFRPSPAACVLYGLEARAKVIARRRAFERAVTIAIWSGVLVVTVALAAVIAFR